MHKLKPYFARVWELHSKIQAEPTVKSYLSSARRMKFNKMGIFRRYAELDDAV